MKNLINIPKGAVTAAFLSLLTAGCVTTDQELRPSLPVGASSSASPSTVVPHGPAGRSDSNFQSMDVLRVNYAGPKKGGSIVLDRQNLKLYFVEQSGKTALQYPIAFGRTGKGMPDVKYSIERKATWPNWYPTQGMRRANPELPNVVPGRINGGQPNYGNPLGAAALYLKNAKGSTLYRIHGTNDPDSIGTFASSGCIRLFNEHIEHLYSQARKNVSVVIGKPAELQFFTKRSGPQTAVAFWERKSGSRNSPRNPQG